LGGCGDKGIARYRHQGQPTQCGIVRTDDNRVRRCDTIHEGDARLVEVGADLPEQDFARAKAVLGAGYLLGGTPIAKSV
jgi:hypothetical protein